MHPLLRQGYPYVERFNTALPRLVPRGARVLDIGCGGGTNLLGLAALGRPGVGLELDDSAAGRARRRGLAVEVGDVRDAAVRARIAERHGRFDVILFADLLEHLVSPQEALEGSLPLLAEGGVVVISVPNVAVWFQRLALLAGRFEYDDTGILDRTHLRFFTKGSLDRWLRDLGFTPERWGLTPSIVASVGRFVRASAKERSDELAEAYPLYRHYEKWVEPVERAICSIRPPLLAFQLVVRARPPRDGARSAAP